MSNDDRSPRQAPKDVGNDERESLGTARRVPGPREDHVPEDLRDTWNVDEKPWNRAAPSVDPFDDIGDEDVQDDRTGYRERSGI